jgi:hypothetical protein
MKDFSEFEPRKLNSYMFEQTWYKAAIIRRMESIISKYKDIDPYLLKLKVLKRLGLGGKEGVFLRHLWLPYLDVYVANPILTVRFYAALKLSNYSLEYLMKYLDELEDASSTLSALTNSKRESKIAEDSMKFLRLIDSSIRKNFRESAANAKLALESG